MKPMQRVLTIVLLAFMLTGVAVPVRAQMNYSSLYYPSPGFGAYSDNWSILPYTPNNWMYSSPMQPTNPWQSPYTPYIPYAPTQPYGGNSIFSAPLGTYGFGQGWLGTPGYQNPYMNNPIYPSYPRVDAQAHCRLDCWSSSYGYPSYPTPPYDSYQYRNDGYCYRVEIYRAPCSSCGCTR